MWVLASQWCGEVLCCVCLRGSSWACRALLRRPGLRLVFDVRFFFFFFFSFRSIEQSLCLSLMWCCCPSHTHGIAPVKMPSSTQRVGSVRRDVRRLAFDGGMPVCAFLPLVSSRHWAATSPFQHRDVATAKDGPLQQRAGLPIARWRARCRPFGTQFFIRCWTRVQTSDARPRVTVSSKQGSWALV